MKRLTAGGWTCSVLFALCAWVPEGHAAWNSIHAENRSTTIPQRPTFRTPSTSVQRAPQQQVFPGGERRTEQSREAYRPMPGREGEREHRPEVISGEPERHEDWGRTREWEFERRRGDFDEDRRGSYYWSRFHRGMMLNTLPEGYFQFNLGNAPYYYYGGVYYEQQPSGYVVVAPPLGAIVPALPPGAEAIAVPGAILYYGDGAFYAQVANGFQVVQPPMGVTVAALPPDATQVYINGITYYQANGIYYQPVIQNGVVVYMTVQP